MWFGYYWTEDANGYDETMEPCPGWTLSVIPLDKFTPMKACNWEEFFKEYG